MEYLVGGLVATVAFLLVDKFRPHRADEQPETEKQKLEREKREKHLDNMMNYNAEKAVGK